MPPGDQRNYSSDFHATTFDKRLFHGTWNSSMGVQSGIPQVPQGCFPKKMEIPLSHVLLLLAGVYNPSSAKAQSFVHLSQAA